MKLSNILFIIGAMALLFVCCISFVGCDYTPTSYTPPLPLKYTYDNPRQNEFDSIVRYYYSVYSDMERQEANELVKDSLLNEYKLTLLDFFDTPIEDWTYRIKYLYIHDTKINGISAKRITFDLKNFDTYYPLPYITFDAVYVVPEDSLDTDHTYNVLKSSKDDDCVKFSGVVVSNRERKDIVHRSPASTNIGDFFNFPKFDVIILDVSKDEGKETEED